MSLVKDMTDRLFLEYDKHKYMLANSYVYKWESDFFSQLASGYHQEIEIKVSRSDFFADFKKEEKHSILQQKFDGAKLICKKGRTYYEVEYEETTFKRDENGRTMYDNDWKRILVKTGKILKTTTCADTYRDEVSRRLLYSNVFFKDVHCPNRFYYCCPKDLISEAEVPKYAGLIYYDDGQLIKIKNAPLIHKEKRNLSQILLDKFYHKYLYSR